MVTSSGGQRLQRYSSSVLRALKKINPGYDDVLRANGLLTRDSRMKERKKYGRRGARRGFQFSKR